MSPTYLNKEMVIVQNVSTLGKSWEPEKWDVIIINDGHGENLSKRVIATAGDSVEIKTGKIYLNNELYKDKFTDQDIIFYEETEAEQALKPKHEWLFLNVNENKITVPEGSVWVIGDNRNISWYGVLKIKNIKALVIF